MTKEEQIEEMSILIFHEKLLYRSFDENAENLINAGYRKADEMRKETAREILDEILRVLEFEAFLDSKNATFNLCLEVVKDVIYEYFEVKE